MRIGSRPLALITAGGEDAVDEQAINTPHHCLDATVHETNGNESGLATIWSNWIAVGAKVLADLASERIDTFGYPESVIGTQEDFARSECKVAYHLAYVVDLAKQDPFRVPDVETVAAASPDIAVSVSVHTIGDAAV
ncbi:unnamed protein product [Phytophthora fragariaefolia]|uniref:Unnamed protein product n=1 Tax=Phytophthora fragariaefolia TaxID=1490495 RepID=A0A9W6WU18_9STRA|nr:unnamed protein product [Phytophthora fragariaefolia]